jgi:UDP-N-acetylglucosamine 2-epimerase (non-hydrolysing)
LKIDLVVGTRPNFMKISPLIDAIINAKKNGDNLIYRLIHTGQHYDKNMSDSFFEDLGIPEPDANLEAGGGTQAEQTAAIMVAYEKLILSSRSDLCLVVGDVNSTMACAIVAQKLRIPVAHVEAGIRSGDWSMPEEINRLLTDSISNYFFTTTREASQTLLNSGVSKDRVFWVGNTMIDTLLKQKYRFRKPFFWDELALKKGQYIVMTLHRPANVDDEDNLKDLIDEIIKNSNGLPLIFPVHPRTAKILKSLQIEHKQLYRIEPLSYLEFNYLVENALAVITDSGGISEETTVMGVPCITLRENTERPETVTVGTNELIGTNPNAIKPALKKLFAGEWKKGSIPELWDGNTSNRIVSILKNLQVGG